MTVPRQLCMSRPGEEMSMREVGVGRNMDAKSLTFLGILKFVIIWVHFLKAHI